MNYHFTFSFGTSLKVKEGKEQQKYDMNSLGMTFLPSFIKITYHWTTQGPVLRKFYIHDIF